MVGKDQIEKLSQLLLETGHAHHQAFIETDGEDPEWPLWYADYLMDRLPAALGRELTKSEITAIVTAFGAAVTAFASMVSDG